MNNISNKIKVSAHHAFTNLHGISKNNLFDAKRIATEYFKREFGRELSMKENDDMDEELARLAAEK